METLSVSSTPSAYLDILLDEVCVALQLTKTQYDSAKDKYNAVADWLAAPGSPLANVEPDVYPQGSMALQTTVKPRGQEEEEEFDVDAVIELSVWQDDPLALYEAIRNRLADHSYYKQILELKKRCLRLNYAGEFHLDVLPAVADSRRGGTCILIPDRELRDWCESNPRGFADWFNDRAEVVPEDEKRLSAEPLPANEPSERRPALKRAVQLLKRRRDVVFNSSDEAPRSIVLTTLAAHHYQDAPGVMDALSEILDGIAHEVETTAGIMEVENPTNDGERFSDTWDAASYQAFSQFILGFRRDVQQLESCSGLPELKRALSELFGEKPTQKALIALSTRMEAAREQQELQVKPGVGLTAVAMPGSRRVPRNTFYGSE